MKKHCFFIVFSLSCFLLSAQSVEQICFGVNQYAKRLHSAYYEAEIEVNNGGESKFFFHKVSFKKNSPRNKFFAKVNAQIYYSNELIEQVYCDNQRFTFVDFYQNIAEQYEKEDYALFLTQVDTNMIPNFVFNRPTFDLKAIEKGEIKVQKNQDTIINGFECFSLVETLLEFDSVSYVRVHYIRKKDFLPLAQNTIIFYLNQEQPNTSSKVYNITLSRIDENAAFHDSRFEFSEKNTGIHLRYKSFSALEKQWEEQEISQSSFAYNSLALNFKTTTLQGKEFELEKHKGKIVIMAFFYNNCSPCIPVLDDLQELYAQYKDRGVEIIALNPVDSKIAKEEMIAFANEHKLSYHLAQIPKHTIEEMYLVRYFPTIFIIDKKGRVCFSHQGYNTLFKDKISKIIEGKLRF
ncbi:MAG: redoxin domain-containing protein [Bacteroidales bacterium]|nr:redoxin domain-containing protein [Bacteroidales bacterium]